MSSGRIIQIIGAVIDVELSAIAFLRSMTLSKLTVLKLH